VESTFLKKPRVFLAILIATVLIGTALFIYLKNKGSAADSDGLSVRENAEKIVTSLLTKDSDNDGLGDWEEELLKTDAHNPDTDEDGTPDGEEIDQRRNPLIAGPNDTAAAITPSKQGGSEEAETSNLTATEKISRELLEGYIELKQGGQLTVQNSEQLITTLIDQASGISPKQYTADDIRIVTTPSADAIKRYGVEITAILKPDLALENDLVVLKRALEGQNSNELSKLDTSTRRYRATVAEMLALSVPQEVAAEHIAAANALARVSANVESMRAVFTDPVGALVGIKEYTVNEFAFIESLQTIGLYLKAHNAIP